MEAWQIALTAMSIYLILAFALGLAAGRGRSMFSVSEYAVGDRGFGLFVMWVLMGGTIFSAFSFLGGPGWAYSKGAASLYILAYCTLGLLPWYIIGPKIAKLGRESNYITIKASMIGTFYRSSSPEKPPFVNVGDSIKEGDTILTLKDYFQGDIIAVPSK